MANLTHIHQPSRRGGAFCPCGKLVDSAALHSIDIQGFTGAGSLNPRVEKFWETGEPEVLKHSYPLDRPVPEMPDRSVSPAPETAYEPPSFVDSPKTLAAEHGW